MKSAVPALALAVGILVALPVWAVAPAPSFDSDLPTQHERIPASGPGFRAATSPDSLLSAILQGADYLQAMQADITDDNAGNGIDGAGESPDDPDDGGWDWVLTSPPDPVSHSTVPSPTNITGALGQALLHAYNATGDAGYLTALRDAADGILADTSAGSSQTLSLLLGVNALPAVAGTAYQDTAKARYDAKITAYGSADSLAKYIRDARFGQGYSNGIIPWDIGGYAILAAELDERFGGYASDADDMADVLWEDTFNANPGYFDLIADAGFDSTYANTDYYWYNLGVTGLINAFVVSDTHTSELPGLVTRLLDGQFASGAVSYSYGANPNDEDWQSTAYAAMALARMDHSGYATEIGDMGTYLADTQDGFTGGGWRYTSDSHYPTIAGENVRGLWAAYLAANSVALSVPSCISVADTCVTVPVTLVRSESEDARGASVTIQLSPELELCGSITRGAWLDAFDPSLVYHVVDNGGGSYTIDQSILGPSCGATTGGVLFEVPVKKAPAAAAEDTGTITVTSVIVRDCANHPLPGVAGSPGSVTIDVAPPIGVADLSTTQVKSGNGPDSTTTVTVNFTAPGDADDVLVYRKGFGDYPEYDDGTGATPTLPATPAAAISDGWTLTSVTTTGVTDEPTTRDFWYYVVFTEDECDNVSAASNMSDGVLNYHLGDVRSGGGDNDVGILDISLLGTNYGAAILYGDPENVLDVGPTTDFSVDARPTTDNVIGFEDLMMFAINYGVVGRIPGVDNLVSVPGTTERPTLDLSLATHAGEVTAVLALRGHEAAAKGIHAVVSYDRNALELVSASQGSLLGDQTAPIFFKTLDREDGLVVDAAALGTDVALAGSGEVAVLTFRATKEGAMPRLTTADLRGRDNRSLGAGPAVDGPLAGAPVTVPTELSLLGAQPNPFAHSTDIVFRLPESRPVSVVVYDVGGRLVRTLTDRTLGAGEHRIAWDGRSRDGSIAGAGIYFYTFRAGDHRETRKLLHVR